MRSARENLELPYGEVYHTSEWMGSGLGLRVG